MFVLPLFSFSSSKQPSVQCISLFMLIWRVGNDKAQLIEEYGQYKVRSSLLEYLMKTFSFFDTWYAIFLVKTVTIKAINFRIPN